MFEDKPYIDYAAIASMSSEEADAYLENLLKGSKENFTSGQNSNLFNPVYGAPVAEDPRQQITGYTRPITETFDPTYEGGVYGNYVGNYDPEGNFQGVDFQKQERSNGFIGDNLSWLGPLLVAGVAALGATVGAAGFGGAGSLGQAAAPITEAIATNLGPAAGYKESIAFLMQQGGLTAAEAQAIMGAAASDILTGVTGPIAGGSLPAWVTETAVATWGPEAAQQMIQSAVQASGGSVNPPGGSTPSGGPDTPPNAPKPPANGFTLPNIAQGVTGLLGGVMAENNADKIYQLGERALNQGVETRDWVMDKGKQFVPYNVTTGTGATKANADGSVSANLNPALKGTIDTATGVANKMFGNAKNFDYDQNALQEYNLMMELMKPQREQQWNDMETRAQAQGRLGLASYADGNSVTGPNGEVYGTSPEMIAWQKAMRDQELKTLLSARQTGLDRQGAMIGQGNQAMQPAIAGNTMEQGLLSTASNYGSNAASTNNNLLQTAVAPWITGQRQALGFSQAALTADINRQAGALNAGTTLFNRLFG